MAKKKAFKGALQGLGLGGEYTNLINRAVRQGWDVQEFVVALVRHPAFRRSFPGLISNGRINDFLAGGAQGISAANLGAAVKRYNNLREQYQDVAQVQGLSQFKITPQRMKLLIQGEISPDEFGRRALIQNTVDKNPELEAWYNQVRKAAGLKPVDKVGLFKDLANRQSDFYNLHEAAQLGLSGLFNAKESLELAKGLGTPGELADVASVVGFIKQNRADIEPELERMGVSRMALASFIGNPGVDPDDIAGKIRTIQANRRAMGQRQTGTFARQGSGGGIALYGEAQSQSY